MPRFFDHALPYVNADKVKPMVKIWGGSSKMSKYDCIDFIVAALQDPAKVQAGVGSLEPWVRNALAMVKRMGGVIEADTLKIAILASGLHPPHADPRGGEFIEKLFRHGLILSTSDRNPGSISNGYLYGRDIELYTDDRILAHIGLPESAPFNLHPMPAPPESYFRHPSSVTLDVVGMLQAIANMGSLKITKSGDVRQQDEARFRKSMRWSEKGLDLDGFLFRDPAKAWLAALRYSNFFQLDPLENVLIPSQTPISFAQRPLSEQARILIDGFLRSGAWWESSPRVSPTLDEYGSARRQGRLALDIALTALPLASRAFFSFKDFDHEMYARIGEAFALDRPPSRPYLMYSATREDKDKELALWKEKTRGKWLARELPWFLSAFSSWLYFLGLVELEVQNGQPIGFRLTELGQAAFHPELSSSYPTEPDPSPSAQPVWVVQPNFDVIAYIDRASPTQLAFLERHAERTQSHPHTAQYRLTRESVYRGLESGTTVDDLIKKLQAGSQADLPQNIRVELGEWAALREQVILHRGSRVVEFSSTQALQAGLAQGFNGRVVAERFLLPDPSSLPLSASFSTIDYARPLPPNLTATESGAIHWKHASHDLMTSAQLCQWALQMTDLEWQLTFESVSLALQSGRKVNELLVFLQTRLSHPVPELLEIALRSWAGEIYSVELESVVILHCPQEPVFRAVLNSPMILPCLRGYIPPDLLIVKAEELETLRRHMEWLGWKGSDQIRIIPVEKPKRL